jgi:PBP1b-binding outer membrane lipoprotein LpoB
MIRKLMVAVAMTVVLLMTGCASVPMAGKDTDAKAKQFVPSQEGVANLYIYRNEIMGSAIKMPVLIDGVAVGDTVAKAYIFKTLPAGSHTIVSKAENDSTLTIDMLAGKNYFVWQEVKMGVLYARSKLHQVDEATGEAGVKECGLVRGEASSEASLAADAAATQTSNPIVATAKPMTPNVLAQPATAAEPVQQPVPAAAIATAAVAPPSSEPSTPIKPMASDPPPQPSAIAEPAQPSVVPSQESAASAAMEPIAQSVATGLGCGAVHANGAATFVATCGTYGVLIDCDGGQCRPIHTVHTKGDE